MTSSTVLKRRSRCPSNLLLSAASPFSALSGSHHKPATEPAKWCSASLTSLFSPFSALLEVPSSRRDPPNAIAHRVHIGFRADAVIALGDRLGALSGGAQEHAGHRQAEGDRRKHERLDASARPRPTTLDGEADDLGLHCGLLFAPDKSTGLDRFEATQLLVGGGKPARYLADGAEQGLGTDQIGRLVEDGIVEIGIGALARLVLSKRLFGLVEGHVLPPGQGLGLKAADKPVSSLGIGKRVLTRLVPNCSRFGRF